ncbi:hypothetical protein [Mesorhizobium sp. ES1-3]|uniref:hypothetical protein n=1 Tax=Mesorhizobium sp. ES1-3 TaxID=2876628 RepID=UPI001CCE74AB|nr:hypothetical protein [Mesorhizobium sp. ES1-3]MBZ9673639.1 hypothetical protein [Mesorhizobium sp. ES1-3]
MNKQTLLALAAGTALLGGWLVFSGPLAHAQIGDFARQAWPIPGGGRRLRRLPHGGRRQAVCRRQAYRDTLRFGTIYSANITLDPETGIGAWTEEQFYRAMHEGVAADGSRLYPVFPYPWFTKASRADVDDIRAYLRTLEPVRSKARPKSVHMAAEPSDCHAGMERAVLHAR